jgi:hypothetical protein
MLPGLGALGEAELSEALDQICLAERVTRDKLVSIKTIDAEISVRYVRSNGCNRTSTYPIAALLPRVIGANRLSQPAGQWSCSASAPADRAGRSGTDPPYRPAPKSEVARLALRPAKLPPSHTGVT